MPCLMNDIIHYYLLRKISVIYFFNILVKLFLNKSLIHIITVKGTTAQCLYIYICMNVRDVL